jgi:Tfp pilus assembly protein PilE
MRKSFTLLELVITMTVTGIIVGSTFQIFMNIYKSYSEIYVMNSIDSQLSNTSMIIVKYLENRVVGSVIDSNDLNFTILSGAILRNNQTLQWIEKAFDSYQGTWSSEKNYTAPNWSGFLDLTKDHNTTLIYLDEANISEANNTIIQLSQKKLVKIFENNISNNPAIFFKGGISASRDCFGWQKSILDENNYSKCAFIGYFAKNGDKYRYYSQNQTKGFGETVEDLQVFEQLYFSWTAYALKVEDDKNLSLYYNYRPWNGDKYSDGVKITLLQNVSKFEYSSNGGTIMFQLCVKNKKDGDITLCRDNIVY